MSATLTKLEFPVWTVPERSRRMRDTPLRMAEVVSALSHALDLATGEPVGHSVKSCILALRIGEEFGMGLAERSDLYYATLLKDAGCSMNASKMFHALGADDIRAKRDVKTTDWTRVSFETVQYAVSHIATGKPFTERVKTLYRMALNRRQHAHDVIKIRCERGATIARLIGLPETTASGIAGLDEHWNGEGLPEGLRRTEIPLLSRIMQLAQTLEVFFTKRDAAAALEMAKERSGKWFDPQLVKAAQSLAKRNALWADLAGDHVFDLAVVMEPGERTLAEGDATFDAICRAFSEIVDAKSPFTFNHSSGVANTAVGIGRELGLARDRIVFLRHAGLLHDLGKMSVSNAILEKPAKLDDAEWRVMRLHPFYTWKILHAIPRFGEMSEVAASHHEKLDGGGYFRGLSAAQLPLEARVLAVADIFEALSSKRPYRDALSPETVFQILRKDAPHALDIDCVEALERAGAGADQPFLDLKTLNEQLK